MKILITSFGVRGDIQPYLALAVGLQRAGHRVTLSTSSDFTEWIESYGVAAHPTPHSMFALMQRPETRAVLTGRNPLRQMRLFRDTMRQVAASGDVLWAALQAAGFVIQSPTSTGALEAAHARGIPVALASPVPFGATRAYPSFFLGPLRGSLGQGYNRLTHALTHRLLWSLMGGPLTNPLRKRLGLKPWSTFAAVMAEARRLGVPMLYGYSAHVLPRPADWDDAQHITGYWFLGPPPAWQPSGELLRFLDDGPPPIYVGFGSMGDVAPEGVTAKVLAALQQAGQRGVLLAGRHAPPAAGQPCGVLFIRDVPHAWLFPQMAAVVHHGGAGTTAAGLRAGVPSIVLPLAGDQHAWAGRVTALGVGLRHASLTNLTVDGLARAIDAAVNDKTLRARAAALGEKIRAEDGVTRAVELIERQTATFNQQAPGHSAADLRD
jgi:sterol 3beta-glucosyltransferase